MLWFALSLIKEAILGSKFLPTREVMDKSGVKRLYNAVTMSSKPLKADTIMNNAALPTKTPSIEMPANTLMALVDFFENR